MSSRIHSRFCSLPYFLPAKLSLWPQKFTLKNTTMSQDSPSLPLPNAPPAASTNNKVALALLAPPSPSSPTLHRCAGVANLFCDSVENDAHKRLFNLSLTGYSPAKKKGGSQKRSAGKGGSQKRGNIITPRESFETGNAADCIDSDKEEDGGYLRRTSSFQPLRSQSPGIQRLPSTVITLHSFVP